MSHTINNTANSSNNDKLNVVVLISGSGSNLQVLIDQMLDGNLPIKITAVISNKADVLGLDRAKKSGIPTKVVKNKDYADRATYDAALQKVIDEYAPELIVLAGFMRILTADFVNHYEGRMLNIHPSLLPRYRGLNTHQRAIDDNAKVHGVSVHYVSAELDGGPVVAQSQVDIKPDDTAQTLAARVQQKEHVIYPEVVRWVATHKLALNNGHVFYENKALTKPINV